MDLLERATRRRIGLVVAPAGYGKSVAVAQYLARAEVPSLWFIVRDEHTKLLGFAWGLARALCSQVPALERGLLTAYQGAAADGNAPVALAAWFAAHLDACSSTIVIDDLHRVLEEPHVRNFILALIERAPADLRWMLLSRSAFDLPLATWLAYGHSSEPVCEDDLRFSLGEAETIAQACGVVLRPGHLDELSALTAGWPAAFIFALRAATRGTELRRIAVETRETLYDYLADQAFEALSPSEQHFLLGTALLPVVDLELLASAGWERPGATYTDLRRHAGFIVPESATTFHYHDLFRDFLAHRLRLNAGAYRQTQLASAALSEAAGRADWALHLRTAAEDRAGVVRMLRAQATKETLSGMLDAIEAALLWLPQDLLRRDAVLLGLLARARAGRSALAESDALYRAAIEVSETADQRAELTMSYARSLHNRQNYEASFAVLGAIDPNDIQNSATRALVLSRLAIYQAMHGGFAEAERLANQTLAATVLGDAHLRSQVLFAACLVSHFSNRLAEARARASAALRAAEQCGNSLLVARYSHFLCVLAFNDGDWEGAAGFLAESVVHAGREGDLVLVDQASQTALLVATMRGDALGIARAEAALGRSLEAYPGSDIPQSFARAMRYACSGDFAAALREAESGLPPAGNVLLELVVALPHLAAYHAASGDRAAALDAIDRATAVLTHFGGALEAHATFVNMGHVVVALAQALLLRSRAANDILAQLEQSEPMPIPAIKCLAAAARTFNRVAQGVAGRDALEHDLAKVREAGLSGYADMLAALPVGVGRSAAAFSTLTKTELRMLRLIARGGTMKAIATDLGRSPDTVETHVRAIIRKLHCKNRGEAVALARDHGIL
jgi:ATP/maltotriose-dependent transcriptional regulator MalT